MNPDGRIRRRTSMGRTRRRGEKGYALILCALLLLPLLAFTGFATDVGAWYARANRIQRAADAASLAGVVWMPDQGRATSEALAVAKRDGFDPSADPNISITVTGIGQQRLRVTIVDASVDQFFSTLFINHVSIARQATAEYVKSIPMGSPINELANDPDTGYSPNFWLNISGPQGYKANGDRHTAKRCDGGGGSFSGCDGQTSTSTNLDYSEQGYTYRVRVAAVTSGQNLNIQVYDPAFFYTGDTCNTANLLDPAEANYATEIAALNAQTVGGALPNPATRYVRGNTSYCAGDQDINGANVQTTYIVRGPDATPFDNYDNPIVTGCTRTFDAYNEDVYRLLNQTDGYRDGPIGTENARFSDHFRRWFTMCSVPSGTVQTGDYFLQMTTSANLTSPPTSLVNYNPAVSTGGFNRYSLRAGFGSAISGTGVAMFADGRLPIYVNQGQGQPATNFYLARITPEYAGQILQLEFYDVADGANSNLTVLPPPDQTGSALSNCTFVRDDSPPAVIATTGCTITGLNNATYNGKTVTVQIPIPANYGCNSASSTGCWFKVALDFGTGNPADTTTWSARVLGDPVRLVE